MSMEVKDVLNGDEALRAWAVEQAGGCTIRARQIVDFVRPPTQSIEDYLKKNPSTLPKGIAHP